MSVSNQETVFQYVGNGITVTFPYNCQVQQANDLDVYLNDAPITSGITKNGIGALSGGSVTFSVAPVAGAAVRLERVVELERTTDYQQNGDFLARVVNPDFDRLWMAIQQTASDLSRALRYPKSDINPVTELPVAIERAGKLLSFDSFGRPSVVAPSSGSAAEVAIALENAINIYASAIGSSKMGWIQSGIGAIPRTIESKLRDFVDVLDFKHDDDPDDTLSFQRAIDAGKRRIHFSGNKNIGGHIEIVDPVIIHGDGRQSQLTFTGLDAYIKIAGTRTNIAQGIYFEHMTFSAFGFNTQPHVFADWARQIKFTNCFIYHCNFSMNHMNFWDIAFTESYDSQLLVQYTQDAGEDNQVSGAPTLTTVFFSNSPIDLKDCVDLQITNSHFFQAGITSRLVNWHSDSPDPLQVPKCTFLISNTFFDSIFGSALDFWDVGLTSITGCFFSAGRNLGLDGVYLFRNWHVEISACVFNYCGNYGMSLESCQNIGIDDCSFIGSNVGGLRTVNNCKVATITHSFFGNRPTVYGGAYIQPIGYIDAGSTGEGIRFTFNNFLPGDMAQNIDLVVTSSNRNIIFGNDGVLDILDGTKTGTTANRPTGAVPLGFQYYDQTLGKPIWHFGAGWRDAAGAAV